MIHGFPMENLHTTLMRLQSTLDSLLVTLQEENSQLSALKINPVSLQMVSDAKSRLLSTIAWHDAQRQQQEGAMAIAAPYARHPRLASCWHEITQVVIRSNEINHKNRMLLERHMKTSREMQEVIVKAGINNTLYGSKGQATTSLSGRACNLKI